MPALWQKNNYACQIGNKFLTSACLKNFISASESCIDSYLTVNVFKSFLILLKRLSSDIIVEIKINAFDLNITAQT